MNFLIIHDTGSEFVATIERDAVTHLPMPACPNCGGGSVSLVNKLTPCYRLECGSCGHAGPRTFAPEWDGRAIKSEQECKRLHLSAQAAALATWPSTPADAAAHSQSMRDVQHVWQVAMQVAITLCERIQINHESHGCKASAHAAARCAQEVQSWQGVSPEVITALLRTSRPAGAGELQLAPLGSTHTHAAARVEELEPAL